MPSTIGATIQDYRDSAPISGYGTSMGMNIVGKEIMNQILDFGNFLRNSFGNQSDYSGLGPRMTKWDGNTMSATESDNLKFSALLTADGFVTVGVSTLGAAPAAEAGSINYTNSVDQFGVFASKAKPQPGALDIIGHGSTISIEVNNVTVNGGKVAVNHRILANLIKRNPQFTGQDIRLLSCSTGKCDLAQNLANKLNVNVFAPNEIIWAMPDCKFFVAPMNAQKLPIYSTPGKMIKFTPKK